jgi:hypothetical protein
VAQSLLSRRIREGLRCHHLPPPAASKSSASRPGESAQQPAVLVPTGRRDAHHRGLRLFDELDSWLESELPEAMPWINSGLHARFDEHSRSLLAMARVENDFDGFLHYFENRQAMIDNMDH